MGCWSSDRRDYTQGKQSDQWGVEPKDTVTELDDDKSEIVILYPSEAVQPPPPQELFPASIIPTLPLFSDDPVAILSVFFGTGQTAQLGDISVLDRSIDGISELGRPVREDSPQTNAITTEGDTAEGRLGETTDITSMFGWPS